MEKEQLEAMIVSIFAHMSEMLSEETRESVHSDMRAWLENNPGNPVFAAPSWTGYVVKRGLFRLWEEFGANEQEPAPARMPTLRGRVKI